LNGRGAGDGRTGIDQLGGAVGGATGFAVVAVLVFGLALGAGALDEAVGQEQVLFGIIGLGDGAGGDMAPVATGLVDVLGQHLVFVGMGRVIVVELDQEVGEIPAVVGIDLIDQFLGADAHLLGFEHDGGAMGVVGTDIGALLAAHFLEANPDVGLDVFQQMTQVNRAVGIGQGTGDQNLAWL